MEPHTRLSHDKNVNHTTEGQMPPNDEQLLSKLHAKKSFLPVYYDAINVYDSPG